MNLLLDTHAVIWFSENNKNLSEVAYKYISDVSNDCYISIASIWEMAIKLKIDKLHLEISLKEFVAELERRNFLFLPIEVNHILYLSHLDLHHKDPFDRLLISQSIKENMHLISRDSVFDDYNVKRIW